MDRVDDPDRPARPRVVVGRDEHPVATNVDSGQGTVHASGRMPTARTPAPNIRTAGRIRTIEGPGASTRGMYIPSARAAAVWRHRVASTAAPPGSSRSPRDRRRHPGSTATAAIPGGRRAAELDHRDHPDGRSDVDGDGREPRVRLPSPTRRSAQPPRSAGTPAVRHGRVRRDHRPLAGGPATTPRRRSSSTTGSVARSHRIARRATATRAASSTPPATAKAGAADLDLLRGHEAAIRADQQRGLAKRDRPEDQAARRRRSR